MNAFAGLDVHKNKCHGTILNEDGETLKDEEFENSLSGMKNFFQGFRHADAVMEVEGTELREVEKRKFLFGSETESHQHMKYR